MRGFREFIARDEEEALFEASYALVRSGVDVEKLNQGLDQIILHEKNWSFNPFRTFGNAGAATAGAVLGSALGPVGTVAGGALGALAGKGIDWLTGKFMGGASVEKIKPAFDNAVQAVSKLQQLLKTTELPNNPKMIQFKQNMDKIANNFAKFQGIDIGGQLDAHRNQELDAKLAAGGGLGGWLRSFKGTNAVSGALKWLGNKAKDIPALNTDMAFRRALAKGVDSLDDWARDNPKKAMLLNIGAGVGGAAAGALGAHGVQNLFSRPQAKIKAPELPQGDGGGGDAAQPNNAGGAQQGGTPPQQADVQQPAQPTQPTPDSPPEITQPRPAAPPVPEAPAAPPVPEAPAAPPEPGSPQATMNSRKRLNAMRIAQMRADAERMIPDTDTTTSMFDPLSGKKITSRTRSGFIPPNPKIVDLGR